MSNENRKFKRARMPRIKPSHDDAENQTSRLPPEYENKISAVNLKIKPDQTIAFVNKFALPCMHKRNDTNTENRAGKTTKIVIYI